MGGWNIQAAKDTQVTVAAMKAGKKEHKKINIGKVERMQDDLYDMMEDANEIQDIMGRSYGMPEVDDDELEAELFALGDELSMDNDSSYLNQVGEVNTLPEIPSAQPIPKPTGEVDMFGLPVIS